jgi:hypothetical protein
MVRKALRILGFAFLTLFFGLGLYSSLLAFGI